MRLPQLTFSSYTSYYVDYYLRNLPKYNAIIDSNVIVFMLYYLNVVHVVVTFMIVMIITIFMRIVENRLFLNSTTQGRNAPLQ